jgi:hypothetical protein
MIRNALSGLAPFFLALEGGRNNRHRLGAFPVELDDILDKYNPDHTKLKRVAMPWKD